MKARILFFGFMIQLAASAQEQLPKVSHAEPIYFDLIRDLGARKGEREINVGMGMVRGRDHSVNTYFVEYEFAPINRLGMEIELPFTHYPMATIQDDDARTSHGLEGIKAAVQYSFLVSEKLKTTLATGYIFEAGTDGSSHHNPFVVAAKRWAMFHVMVYAGPSLEYERRDSKPTTGGLINTSIHYVIPGSGNFLGIEFNEEFNSRHFTMVIRPQVKLKLSSTAAVGVAVGIPGNASERQMDFLVRCIYEPKRKS